MRKSAGKSALAGILAVALTVSMMPAAAAGTDAQGKDGAFSDQEMLVVFDDGISNGSIGKILDRNDAELEDVTKVGGEKIALATIDEGEDLKEVMDDVQGEKKVLFTQPNFVYKVRATDPYLKDASAKRYQYHLDMIHARDAWKEVASAKKQKTKVAVLDTGVDTKHEDLQANVKTYKRAVAGKIVDGEYDTGSHGTHVTGIIGATNGNGKGGSGVASGENNDLVDIMVVANSEDGYSMTTYNLVTAMNYAIKNGAKVINMSYGADVRDRINNAIIKEAYYDKGVVFVAAAGNDDTDWYSDPADLKEVIDVCNVNAEGYREGLTNYGWAKDISAPGTNIVSTTPNGQYAKMSGTSMASPVIAGVCALMLDVNPSLTPAQVRNILGATAVKQPKGASANYYLNNGLGYGLVDAQAAVKAAKAAPTSSVASISIKKDADAPIVEVPVENIDDSLYGGDVKYHDEGVGLEVLMTPANTSAKVTWKSSNTDIAVVDDRGIVTGKKPGSATITATAGGKSDTCTVQVFQSVDPTSIHIDLEEKDKTMYVGEISDIMSEAVRLEPARKITNNEVYWKSSNWDVITIDDMGSITARKAGKATVSAMTYNGKVASVQINVVEPPASIEITKKKNWLVKGQSYTFGAVVKDTEGKVMSGQNIKWESGNKTIALVDKKGKMKTKGDGYVYIFAKVNVDVQTVDGYVGELKAYEKVAVTKKNYKGKDYGLKVKKKTNKYVSLKWNRIPKVTVYEVCRATKKNGKYKVIKKLKEKQTTFKDKKVKKGKTYFYKVRARYKKNGKAGKYGFSRIVKAKAKTVKK